MTEDRQALLDKNRSILLATLEYLSALHSGSFVGDDHDPVRDFYESQKLQIEKYFKQRNHKMLQSRLSTLLKGHQLEVDLEFEKYIREKTGYSIDLLSDLKKRVQPIITQEKINNDRELGDVAALLRYYDLTNNDTEDRNTLRDLLLNYP